MKLQGTRYLFITLGTKHMAVKSNGRGCSPQNAGQTLHESDSPSLHPRFPLGEVYWTTMLNRHSKGNLSHRFRTSTSTVWSFFSTWYNKRQHGARPIHGRWPWESCEKETIADLQRANQLCQQSRRLNRKKKINKIMLVTVQRVPCENLGQGVILSLLFGELARRSPQHRPKLDVENA